MTAERFKHLDGEINAKKILETPVHLVDEKHLLGLEGHFKDIKKEYFLDIEVVDAANHIISKIEQIIHLGKTDFSGEIMQAANNKDYKRKYRAV